MPFEEARCFGGAPAAARTSYVPPGCPKNGKNTGHGSSSTWGDPQLLDQRSELVDVRPGMKNDLLAAPDQHKVLATDLLLGQRARGLQQHDPERWQLYAATTLLSGIVVRGVSSADGFTTS